MLSDWYHVPYTTLVDNIMNPLSLGGPIPPTNNANLINGKMLYPCSRNPSVSCQTANYSAFNFDWGKTYRLRLMNVGSGAIQKFSIDLHNFTVIANDFMPIKVCIAVAWLLAKNTH